MYCLSDRESQITYMYDFKNDTLLERSIFCRDIGGTQIQIGTIIKGLNVITMKVMKDTEDISDPKDNT